MTITVECKQCGARFSARDEHAGKRGACPKCKGPITVPRANPLDTGTEKPTCPKCGVSITAGQTFCEECGHQLKKGSARKRSRSPRRRMSLGQKAHLEAIRRARFWILAVAVLHLIGALFFFIAPGEMDSVATIIIVVNIIYAAIYAGFGFWSNTNPFAASLAAMILFCTTILVNVVIDPTTIFQGILIKIFVILALLSGMKSGLRYRRYMVREKAKTD